MTAFLIIYSCAAWVFYFVALYDPRVKDKFERQRLAAAVIGLLWFFIALWAGMRWVFQERRKGAELRFTKETTYGEQPAGEKSYPLYPLMPHPYRADSKPKERRRPGEREILKQVVRDLDARPHEPVWQYRIPIQGRNDNWSIGVTALSALREHYAHDAEIRRLADVVNLDRPM